MGNSYKNCKIQDNTAELIYENGSLFVTIFENNIVHVAQKPGIESVAIEEGAKRVRRIRTRILPSQSLRDILSEKMKKKLTLLPSSKSLERMMLFTVWEISRDASTSVDIHM